MRQCEFKKRYDPDMDIHVRKHIYGEGIGDIFKSVGKKLFGKTAKSIAKTAAKTAATKAATTAATKTGEYAGKKAGDKIVELLSKKKKTPSIGGPPASMAIVPSIIRKPDDEITTQEVNDRVNRILSGGKLRRRNFI